MTSSIGVVGGGAWGTALAQAACRAGLSPLLWAREPEVVESITSAAENTLFLPGVPLDAGIAATGDLNEVARRDLLLLVVPAQFLRATARALRPALRPEAVLVVCAKGIELGSGALLSEVLAEEVPAHRLAVLSGPTFAREVALGLPTAITVAAADGELAGRLVTELASATFRPYASTDPVGAEIGGAVKNVLAIACGIAAGRKLGDNARAALITRGLAEIIRLGRAKGAQTETLVGLAGLGDLALTCASEQSRNFSLGRALGEGKSLAEIQAGRVSVAEGVSSAGAVVALADRLGVEMPIVAAVDRVVNAGADIGAMIAELLARPPGAEFAAD